jgi:serine/threonine protein kinase
LENVLVSSGGVCKIIDFGMALRLPRNHLTGGFLKVKPLRPCGKQNYIAPEALANADYYNPQLSDIWSAGCLLFIMLIGVPPYETSSEVDVRFRYLISGNVASLLAHWNAKIDPDATDLLNGIFKLNPEERLSIDGILNHPWLRSSTTTT